MPQKRENSPCKCELDCVSICSVRESSLAVCNKEALTIANIPNAFFIFIDDKAHQSTYYQHTKWKRMSQMNERAKERYKLQKELKRQLMCLLCPFYKVLLKGHE